MSGETRLFAKWIRVIDNVQLSFVLPSVGEQIQSPFLPEGALYRVSEFHVYDENYYTVEEIARAGEYELIVFLVAVPGDPYLPKPLMISTSACTRAVLR